MTCQECQSELLHVVYTCESKDYTVRDSQGALIATPYPKHGLSSNDEEIGDQEDGYYCSSCALYVPKL